MKRTTACDTESLTVRTRLAIFHGTTMQLSKAITAPEADIHYDKMLEHGVKAVNLVAARLAPTQLKARGFDVPNKFKHLGYDSLHLTNPSFCHQMLLCFGRDAVLEHFLQTPEDAVGLAGSPAVDILKLSTSDLLSPTVGFPSHAFAVLKQLTPGASLKGVSPQLLLDCGLRFATLKQCGYTLERVVQDTQTQPADLEKLGFV